LEAPTRLANFLAMPFPKHLLADHETVIFDLKPHWISVVPAVLWTIGFILVYAVGYQVVDDQSWSSTGQNALGILALIGILFMGVIPFLRWYFTIFVLTSDRLITRSGVIAKHSKEIPLERVNDVTFSQTVIERALGAGDLLIESAGERGQNRISNVRKPEQVQLMIYKEIESNNLRAASSGYKAGIASAPPTGGNIPDQIAALARLKEQGVITDAEFEAKKQELLKRL
jgi:membrane protein YdbS with pleckstrin-like domain